MVSAIMPELTHLALFFAAALVLAVTPGPGIFYVVARTLAGGRAEGLASSLGTALGGVVHVLAGSVGVSAVVLASGELFAGLKLIGALYLIWLGLRTFVSAREYEPILSARAAYNGPLRAFREGVLVEALNPKTAAFFLAFVPQFVDPAHGPVALQFVVLGCLSVTLNTLADIVVVLVASNLRRRAAARPTLIRRMREVSGAAMVTLGIGLALAKRPSG